MSKLNTDETVEVFVDNIKSDARDDKPCDDSSTIEASVDILLSLKENTGEVKKNRAQQFLSHGLIEVMVLGRQSVYPLRIATRSFVFVARNAARILHVGSATEVQNKMKMVKNALLSGGPVFILTGVVIFLFTEINIFPVLNLEPAV